MRLNLVLDHCDTSEQLGHYFEEGFVEILAEVLRGLSLIDLCLDQVHDCVDDDTLRCLALFHLIRVFTGVMDLCS